MASASVNILVRNQEGLILLQMRNSKPKCNPLTWDFWGGGMEEGENPLIAASRELNEELGLETTSTDFTPLCEGEDKAGKVFFMDYLQKLNWKDIVINEGAGAAFFTPEEILKLNATDRVKWFIETQAKIAA